MKIIIIITLIAGLLVAPTALADSSVVYDWVLGQPSISVSPNVGEYFDWSFGQPTVVEKFTSPPVVSTSQIWTIEID